MFADDPWMDSILKIESVEALTLWVGADKLAASTRSRTTPGAGGRGAPAAGASGRSRNGIGDRKRPISSSIMNLITTMVRRFGALNSMTGLR